MKNQNMPEQQKIIEEAKKAWSESEWVLNVLRTLGTAANPKTEEEIVTWYRTIKVQKR